MMGMAVHSPPGLAEISKRAVEVSAMTGLRRCADGKAFLSLVEKP